MRSCLSAPDAPAVDSLRAGGARVARLHGWIEMRPRRPRVPLMEVGHLRVRDGGWRGNGRGTGHAIRGGTGRNDEGEDDDQGGDRKADLLQHLEALREGEK